MGVAFDLGLKCLIELFFRLGARLLFKGAPMVPARVSLSNHKGGGLHSDPA